MNVDRAVMLQRASELRRSFDESFARAHAAEQSASIDLLMLRVDTEIHAVRLSEIAGFHVAKKIARFPSPLPELMGLLALRGSLVPVYDLAALLGYSTRRTPSSTILAKQVRVAFAFEAFEHQLRVDPGDIAGTEQVGNKAKFVRELVQTNGHAHPILDLPAIVSAVEARARSAQGFFKNKER